MCASAHPARKFAAIRWSEGLKDRNGMQGLQVVNNLERWNEGRCLGLRRVLFLIFKIHLYQIIWLSAILAFRFAFSRLHSSGLLHVTGSLANARLRPTKNLAPFHNFCKIVPLRLVFVPVEFSSKTLTSPINCYKQIQNWAVLDLFYARLTPSSSQSGKANCESAASGGKNK